ncbi:MAG TPA: Mut7-C RNAse domain-containing protein [Methanomicrobiales archaeon]|nr:Mut7-C RNAse domain-containing protein [Methanomicrobiales archaeon]
MADRMLGTLTRYLRFMGYDTLSANSLEPGNAREDTALLAIARDEDRILLTRDRELARRGGDRAVFLGSEDVMEQVRALTEMGLVTPKIVMDRCSLCNTLLCPATEDEVTAVTYVPGQREGLVFFRCPSCNRIYWMGSHGRNLMASLRRNLESS